MIKISAVGDIFFGDYTISLGFGIKSSIKKHGFEYNFKHVVNCFKNKDIVIGNLETITSDIGIDERNIKTIICRGEKGSVNILKHAGFNVVNIANNHILQHGVDPFYDTINELRSKGIDVVGLKGEGESTCASIIKNIHGKRVGILGYSLVNENYYKGSLLYASGGKEGILHDIIELKKNTDYIIVSCHWGLEFIDRPSLNIQRLARKMVDAGASIILGHHPHVVQGIERYKNSLILYSLGNFLFDFLWNRRARETMIANLFISDHGIDYEILPVYISPSYQVEIMEEKPSKEYAAYVNKLSGNILKENILDEDHHYKYYVEANRIFIFDQIRKIMYVMKNVYRLDKRFIVYIIKKIIKI